MVGFHRSSFYPPAVLMPICVRPTGAQASFSTKVRVGTPLCFDNRVRGKERFHLTEVATTIHGQKYVEANNAYIQMGDKLNERQSKCLR